jgi:CheY-like chemotaxis protein
MSNSHEPEILIVDDNAAWRRMLAEILLSLKIGVIRRVESADEARAMLLERPIDLVLSDHHMPGEDGLSLLRWMRGSGNPRLREVPFILLSMDTSFTTYQRSRCCGAHYFVSKPVTVRSLANAITHSFRTSAQAVTPSPCGSEGEAHCPYMRRNIPGQAREAGTAAEDDGVLRAAQG